MLIYKFKEFISWIRRDVPNFFRNIWKFRKALKAHRWWDYHGTMRFIEIGISDIATNIEKSGNEVAESRLKKVYQMKRAVEILKNINDDRYFDIVEKELGGKLEVNIEWDPIAEDSNLYQMKNTNSDEQKEFNKKYCIRLRELEESEWNELWDILKGKAGAKEYGEKFDGTDLRGWWD